MNQDQRQDATTLVDEGVSLAEQGRLDEAIELFTQAIETDPNCRQSYRSRAEAYRRQGKDTEASRDEISSNMLAVGGRFSTPHTSSSTTDPENVGDSEMSSPSTEALGSDAEVAAEDKPPSNEVETADALEGQEIAESQAVTHPTASAPGSDRRAVRLQSDTDPLRVAVPVVWGGTQPHVTTPPPATDFGPVVQDVSGRPYGAWLLNRWGFREGFRYWTVERLLRSLLLMAILAVAGSVIAKVSFCPEGVTGSFWTGCGVEMLAFTLGGAALGGLFSLFVTWGIRR